MHSTLRLLSDSDSCGVLDLKDRCAPDDNRTVEDILRDKHPPAGEMHAEALVTTSADPPRPHPVIFERLTGEVIRSAALRTRGAAGPSGIDAAGWRRLCCSFQRESTDLCAAVADFARRISTEHVDPVSLQAFLACRLIPLDKNPGVRPIGICEVVRRIVGKAVMAEIKTDVMQAAGPLQLCAGHEAGAEAAVHAMRVIFEDANTDGILFVDASNAFNNLNRSVALINIQYVCPPIATIIINCYRQNAELFVGGSTLFSREGTTQGDPLAMAMFALATVPLIRAVATQGTSQTWFADDTASGGKFRAMRVWWDALSAIGPKYGYHPNALKTYLLTKVEREAEAKLAFAGTGVQITSEGRRYLGGAFGEPDFKTQFLHEKVSTWTGEIERLATIARTQPHASFAALTHGVIGRWVYSLRTAPPFPESLLAPLENAVAQVLIPALTFQPAPNDLTRQLLALPSRLGGLGIKVPTTLAASQHQGSCEVTAPLVSLIIQQGGGDMRQALAEQQHLKRQIHQRQRQSLCADAAKIIEDLPSTLQRCALAAQEKGVSSWLAALPLEQLGFSLSKREFHDAIGLRYNWPLHNIPATCACGQAFTTDHALVCRCGGFVARRHDQVRNLTATLLRETCSNVCVEPELQPLSGEHLRGPANREDQARLDIRATDFWGNAQDAFFDVRVFYPFAPSYCNRKLAAVYKQHETQKRRQYGQRVREIERGTFTPLVLTTGGGMAREATTAYRRLANLLSEKRNEAYGTVMGWMRCALSFCLLRSAIMCVRGTRQRRSGCDLAPESFLEVTATGRVPHI